MSLIVVSFQVLCYFSHTGITFQQIPPYTCTTTICKPGVGDVRDTVQETQATLVGPPGKRGAVGLRGEKGQKGVPCQCNIIDEEDSASIKTEIQSLKQEIQETRMKLDKIEDRQLFYPTNCTEHREGSGDLTADVVAIHPFKSVGDLTPLYVNCTDVLDVQDTDGWITIQRRLDGSQDFYLNWESYARGFGNPYGEFWLGLRLLHLLTSTNNYKLQVNIKNWDGSTLTAEYGSFSVGDEESKFQLTISGFSGQGRDNFAHHNKRRFSSYDQDNDDHSSANCAVKYVGAWWYGSCYHSNLNGRYFKTKSGNDTGVWWGGFINTLPFVEMKIRQSN